MTKFAIVRFYGKQYKVTEGSELLIDKISDSNIEPQVLLYVDEKMTKVGKPVLKDTKVKLKILNQEEKGAKVDIFKYKSKSRYRRHLGFRPIYTRLLIQSIG